MNAYMNLACQCATNNQDGGPFGAVIIKSNEVIAVCHNEVLKRKDPTAHAEIMAIRLASQKLNTYDLTGCVMYTTCEPCPMCLSAIIWSNIETVYYGSTRNDAFQIGFRDKAIYDYLNGTKTDLLNIKQLDSSECSKLFEQYKNTIY